MSIGIQTNSYSVSFKTSLAVLGLLSVVLRIGDENATCADEPQAGRSMKITVLGPNNKPLPKAKIHAAIWAKVPAKSNRDYVSDEQGVTRVELPDEIGILRLWVHYEGHVSLFASWSPQFVGQGLIRAEEPIPDEFTFELEKGTVIGGTVVDEAGQPIPGARVQVMLDVPSTGLAHKVIPDIWLAYDSDAPTTDAQGRWSLNNVPEDAPSLRFILGHTDYLSDYKWRALPGDPDEVMEALRNQTAEFVMKRGITVAGTVTDADGKAVADAVVIWGNDPYGQDGSQEVRTDAKGKYKFPPLEKGDLAITVVAPGWAPDQQQFELSPDHPPVDFKLARGKTVRLWFVDDARTPIPDVYVSINGWRGGKALYNHRHPNVLDTKIPVASDKNGVFEWTWAPDDGVIYNIGKEGYQPTMGFEIVPDGEDIEITLRKAGK